MNIYLNKFKFKHKGEACYIFGDGPSIKSMDLSLFKDLPVLIVDNWSDINSDKLNLFLESLLDRTFNFDSLYLTHWTSKIKGSNPLSSLVSSFSDYRINTKNILEYTRVVLRQIF